jgi:hypothetical protein
VLPLRADAPIYLPKKPARTSAAHSRWPPCAASPSSRSINCASRLKEQACLNA